MSDSDVVIRVEGLGKKYALHHEKAERYTALRDVLARQAKAAGRLLNPFTLAGQLHKAQREAAADRAESEEEFWALKDVNFEIRRGERVGIIGRNGAGKSTLLKILSRITEPTTGRVEIRGRVASLLEVGTGFHPELTGRENIYLNGAILGMTRREIRSKFDEIVDFAEVEKFLDTPVKRYSSGMYVRLAFAVAAHLDPEILVVDEVLAVGDASFQKKCLGKMEDVADNDGRSVLFVSHQIAALDRLCPHGVCLQNGEVIYNGPMRDAIDRYLGIHAKNNPADALKLARSGNGAARLQSVEPLDASSNVLSAFRLGELMSLRFRISASEPVAYLSLGFTIYNDDRVPVATVYSSYDDQFFSHPGSGHIVNIIATLGPTQIFPGKYSVSARLTRTGEDVDSPQADMCQFEVLNSTFYHNSSYIIGHKSITCLKPIWLSEKESNPIGTHRVQP